MSSYLLVRGGTELLMTGHTVATRDVMLDSIAFLAVRPDRVTPKQHVVYERILLNGTAEGNAYQYKPVAWTGPEEPKEFVVDPMKQQLESWKKPREAVRG